MIIYLGLLSPVSSCSRPCLATDLARCKACLGLHRVGFARLSGYPHRPWSLTSPRRSEGIPREGGTTISPLLPDIQRAVCFCCTLRRMQMRKKYTRVCYISRNASVFRSRPLWVNTGKAGVICHSLPCIVQGMSGLSSQVCEARLSDHPPISVAANILLLNDFVNRATLIDSEKQRK